jgi:hypothetical protein
MSPTDPTRPRTAWHQQDLPFSNPVDATFVKDSSHLTPDVDRSEPDVLRDLPREVPEPKRETS